MLPQSKYSGVKKTERRMVENGDQRVRGISMNSSTLFSVIYIVALMIAICSSASTKRHNTVSHHQLYDSPRLSSIFIFQERVNSEINKKSQVYITSQFKCLKMLAILWRCLGFCPTLMFYKLLESTML